MEINYQIITDATADICPEMLSGLPKVSVIPMNIVLDGNSFTYGPEGNISIEKFYEVQRNGKVANTSQINPAVYFDYFEKCLKNGVDVIYLCFSSGMSGSFQNAQISASELKEKYPERKIICIDTLAASVGEGFLVREAARKQLEGMNIEELADWVLKHRKLVSHWFSVDTLEHLRHGGRISAATAVMGTVLQIKPLLYVSDEGKLQMKDKVRGRKLAIKKQLEKLEKGWLQSEGSLIVIGHADVPDRAEELRTEIKEQFPNAEIYVAPIGAVIGSHTGPGMLVLAFWGNDR